MVLVCVFVGVFVRVFVFVDVFVGVFVCGCVGPVSNYTRAFQKSPQRAFSEWFTA